MTQTAFRVLLLDTKFQNPNHYICIALRDALKRVPGVELVIKADPLNAIALATQNQCNLFLAFDGEELDETLCRRLASVCGRSVLWVTEDPYEISVNLRHAAMFDLVFTNDSASVAAYGDKGRHLPLAGGRNIHLLPVLPPEVALRYELFFAGTAWPNRAAFIRSLLHDMPKTWRYKFALPMNPHLPPRNVALPESELSWRTSAVDFGRFVNRSAVTILLPRVFSASGDKEYAETPPPRLFEAALAGGVQLVHESLAEVTHAFEPDREILMFSDERDFLSKVGAVVNDRTYRNRLAEAARERALRDHTYENRAGTILDAVRKLKPQATPAVDTIEPRRKTLLFVCHNYLGGGHFGGVEIYLDRLKKALKDEFDVLFYVRGPMGENKDTRLLSSDYQELRRFRFADAQNIYMLSSPEREKTFQSLLLEFRVDFVHFHHFIGHVPSLVHIAKALGIPTAITFHDYLALCNEFQLISFKKQFCGAPDVSLAQCDLCLWKKHGINPGSQAARREFWGGVVEAADLLIFNTEGERARFAAVYPSVRKHLGTRVLPVPIPDPSDAVIERQASARDTDDTKVLKVALLGNVTFGKGGELVPPLTAALASAPVEFHVFGRIDDTYRYLNDKKVFPNVVVHGGYVADEMPAALLDCEVSIHSSIWPETYCLTLSEAWQLNLVPIVSDIGALGERVTDGVNGMKVRPGEEGDLINAVRLLAEDRQLLHRLRANIPFAPVALLREHVKSLIDEYRQQLRPAVHSDVPETPNRQMTLADLGIVLNSPSWPQTGGAPKLPASFRGTGATYSKAELVYRFYREHGFKRTTLLFARHGKRLIWKK